MTAVWACCGCLSAAPGPCVALTSSGEVQLRISKRSSPCVRVAIDPGVAIQLAVEQPIDIALRVNDSTVDAFEFGRETVTISQPGLHKVDVELVANDGTNSSWKLSVSYRTVSLQEAESWRQAEFLASQSKRTGEVEDIVASLQIWRGLNDPLAIARTHLKDGDALVSIGDPLHARTAYEEGLRICEQIPQGRCEAEAANNSGYASFLLGELDTASRRLRQAAAVWHGLAMPLSEGRTLNNLGMMFRQSGNFEEAIRALGEARRRLDGRDLVVYAQVLNNLGLCYQSLFENQKAIAYFQSALSLLVARSRRTSRLRVNLARSYLLLGKAQLAIITLHSAIREAATNPAVRADALSNMGQALLRLARLDEARTQLSEALILQKTVGSKRGEAIALHYLGIVALQQGESETARTLLTQAIRIRREIGVRDELSETVFSLAELEFKMGNVNPARELVQEAIGLAELLRVNVLSPNLRATYYARKRRFFDLLMEIEAGKPHATDPNRALLVSEQSRGRAALDLVTAGVVSGVIPIELENRRSRLRHQIELLSFRIAELELEGRQRNEAARNDIDKARDDLRRRAALLLTDQEQVESEVWKVVKGTAVGRPLISSSDIQSSLSDDTALLEYYVGERESYLWVVQRQEIRFFRLPPRSRIEPLVKRTVDRFSAVLERRRSANLRSAFAADLRSLSDILVGPLGGLRLPPRLVFVLDGPLNYVPIAALRPSWAQQPIGLAFDLIQAPSAAFLLATKYPRPVRAFSGSLLAVADPVFSPRDSRVLKSIADEADHGTLSRLPFTGELAVVRLLVPPSRIKVLRGFDASRQRLTQARVAQFAVLHFSTHAVIDDDLPELSRIALSLVDRDGRRIDGYLHPYQFSDYRLDRSIVVLASCETGLGKHVAGEGFLGFATALFSAGSSQVVLTATKVDAESSSAFFGEVYRRYFDGKEASMESALKAARRALASSSRWSDPFYWAPYVIIGGPTPTR